MNFSLRPYQSDAIDAAYRYLDEQNGNPAIVIPTGGGKTAVLATLAFDVVDVGGRVMILSHVKELLEQAANSISRWIPKMFGKVGVYSAGLKSRDTREPCLIAGIQSVYKRACEVGPLDLIVVDEAHLIPPSGDGMYRTFLETAAVVNPDVRVVGLTATPYRLRTGMIVGRDQILDEIVYEAGVRELIDQGYLCELRSKEGDEVADLSGVHIRGGEYIESEAEDAMRVILESACDEILERTGDRRGTLIFAPGVRYAREVAAYIESKGVEIGAVFGDTDTAERDATIAAFKRQELRYLVNVNVLTTGFDATHVDCIAMLRPTLSPGLYYQMVGRGLRLHEGKENCLVLDYAGNVMRHGPIDAIEVKEAGGRGGGEGEAPMKPCPECKEIVPASVRKCWECGYVWPIEIEPKHSAIAHTTPILSPGPTVEWFDVLDVKYRVWIKKDNPEAPRTMCVEYRVALNEYVREWVCVEHDGYPGDKAERWWARRTTAPCPPDAEEAVKLAKEGALTEPTRIQVRRQPKEFDRIVAFELGPAVQWSPEPEPDGNDWLRAIGQRLIEADRAKNIPAFFESIVEESDAYGERYASVVLDYVRRLDALLADDFALEDAVELALPSEPVRLEKLIRLPDEDVDEIPF